MTHILATKRITPISRKRTLFSPFRVRHRTDRSSSSPTSRPSKKRNEAEETTRKEDQQKEEDKVDRILPTLKLNSLKGNEDRRNGGWILSPVILAATRLSSVRNRSTLCEFHVHRKWSFLFLFSILKPCQYLQHFFYYLKKQDIEIFMVKS